MCRNRWRSCRLKNNSRKGLFTKHINIWKQLNGKKAYWHTTSHIMAQAIKRLYPEIKLAIGPSIDNGFYYDFDTEKPFTPEMLEAIEKEMKK